MTVEEFNEANKNGDFDFFTTGMAVENLDAFTERVGKLNDYLGELAINGKLSAESLDNIVKNYAFLLQGSDGSFGAGNILGNLAELYAGGSESNMAKALAGKFQREAVTSETWWSAWKESDLGKAFVKKDSKNTTFSSFSDAMGAMTDEEKQSYIDYVSSLFTPDLYEEVQKKLIEWQTKAYENEISNLESIRDSLDDVNKQREKEIALIKAKEALENASKEKKRVYRAGVGFVYTTDQEAIKSAQDKVDELERQQDKDNIQYQIDSLQQQKEILENLENNKQLENLTTFVKNIQQALGTEGDKSLFSKILTEDESKTNLINIIADGIKKNAQNVKTEENLAETRTAANEYTKAYDDYIDYVEKNKDILNDPNNPAYTDTVAKVTSLWGSLVDKKSKYETASQVQGLTDQDTEINSKLSNIASTMSEEDWKGKTYGDANTNDSFSKDFDWGRLAAETAGAAGLGLATGNLILGAKNTADALVGGTVQQFMEGRGVDVGTFDLKPNNEIAAGDALHRHMIGDNRDRNDGYVLGTYNPTNQSWDWKIILEAKRICQNIRY